MNQFWFLALCVLLGGLAGWPLSIITRTLPIRMKFEWDADASAHLGLPIPEQPKPNWFSWHGDGASAAHRKRGRVITTVCALALLLAGFKFGPSPEWIVYSSLLLGLIAAAVVDQECQLLPDAIVQPLLWAGLLYIAWSAPQVLQEHLLGAMLGYLLLRYIPGVGEGDAKLSACAGAWVGAAALPWFFLIGASCAVVAGLAQRVLDGSARTYAFGPHLAIALTVCILRPL